MKDKNITMIKKILLILLLSSTSYAQIVGMDEASLPVLNQQLRYSERRISEIEGTTWDINTRTSGILTTDRGGTEQDFSGEAEGSLIVFDAAGDMATVAIGTSGQVLTSNGTTAAWEANVDTQVAIGIATTRTFGVDYTASTDGHVTAWSSSTYGEITAAILVLDGKTDDNADPVLSVVKDGYDYKATSVAETRTAYGGIAFPVKSGYKYSVDRTISGDSQAGAMYWTPQE